MHLRTTILAAAAAFAFASTALAQSNDFNQVTDTAGATVDRYAPATFQSGVAYGGHAGTLEAGVAAADGANNRPGAYSSAFYNTQGEAFAFDPGVTEMSIQLYGDNAYTTMGNQRIAGFWGVGYDSVPSISAYPIIELEKLTGTLNLRGFDTTLGTWTNYGLSSFTLGGWNTLGIKLNTGLNTFEYRVNGTLLGTSGNAGGSLSIGSAIIQAHNTTDGVTYNNHWDNLTTGAVPEPATWALMIMGFGSVGATLRRRRTTAALA